MKKLQTIYIFIFILILILPVIFFNYKPNQISEIDNRNLAERPRISSNTIDKFPVDFEHYFEDRIGFRNDIIRNYTKINDNVFHEMIHPSYTYGKDGYVFFKFGRGRTDYDFLSSYANFIKRFQDYCQDRDIYFIYMFNPGKYLIYEEYLPKGYVPNTSAINYFINTLEDLEINFYWSGPDLIERAKEEQVYNKKYDAGHWNDLGCYYATSELLKIIEKDFPNLDNPDLSKYELNFEQVHTLPVSEFPINENIPVLSLPEYSALENQKYYSEIITDDQYRTFYQYENKKTNAPNALMFHGSYYNSSAWSKIIAYPFNQFTGIHNYYNSVNYDYYINIIKPEIVILSSTDYATTENYFPVSMIDNAKYAKPSKVTDFISCKEISNWIIEDEFTIFENNQITQTTLRYDAEMFEPEMAWCLLDTLDYEYSTRLEKNENNESVIKIAFSTSDATKNTAKYLKIFAQNLDGQRILQKLPIEYINQED